MVRMPDDDVDGAPNLEIGEPHAEFLLDFFEHLPDLYFSTSAADRKILTVNQTCVDRLGYADRSELIGKDVVSIVAPESRAIAAATFKEFQRTGVADNVEMKLVTKTGEPFEGLLHSTAVRDAEGNIVRTRGVFRPIDPSTLESGVAASANEMAREAAERFRLTFEQAPIGMTIVDTTPEAAGQIIDVNRAFCELVGRSREELLEMSFLDLTHPDEAATSRSQFDQMVAREIDNYELDKRYVHSSGRTIWVRVTASLVRDSEGRPLHSVGHVQDVSEQIQSRRKLAHQATHDTLTGLVNRDVLVDRLDHAIASLSREQDALALFFLDLDRFKYVNDTFGHQVGDGVLAEVGSRLQGVVRPGDTVSRLGGDEFVVVCPTLAKEQVAELGDRLRAALAEPFRLGADTIRLTGSIGVVTAHDDDLGAEDLLAAADSSMYRAKLMGRDQTVVHEGPIAPDQGSRLDTERMLAEAVEEGWLRLEYQPVVGLYTHDIVGSEALVRVDHPTRGRLEPDSFIPVAEENGQVIPIGAWVMGESTKQCASWNNQGIDIGVSVNLATRQVLEDGLDEVVFSALAESGLDPDRLCLELTETTLLAASPTVLAVLSKFREAGIHLALDDFGTGYSSLGYLRGLPIDIVKIDGSFVSGVVDRREDRAIVGAVSTMVNELGLGLVAEGVEADDVAETLLKMGCPFGQGYLFGKPMSSTEFENAF
jgi:diguanylate cyclase (GGDEF)-like protein/PAS domain S-box-containing protein